MCAIGYGGNAAHSWVPKFANPSDWTRYPRLSLNCDCMHMIMSTLWHVKYSAKQSWIPLAHQFLWGVRRQHVQNTDASSHVLSNQTNGMNQLLAWMVLYVKMWLKTPKYQLGKTFSFCELPTTSRSPKITLSTWVHKKLHFTTSQFKQWLSKPVVQSKKDDYQS